MYVWFSSKIKTFKYATNIRMCLCWNDAPGNGRSLCPHFLGRAFIYLFVHLFTFLGWMLEVILCLKPAGRTVLSDYRLRVDAGRRSNQRRDLGAGCSRGLPAYVWEVGDQTEGRRKHQRWRVCLHKEDDYRALLSKKCLLAASLKPSNLFIWWFWYVVFLIYFTASSSSQTRGLQEDQCPQRIQFLQRLGAAKKVTMNLIKGDFSVPSLRRRSSKTPHQVALKGLLWAQRMRCRHTSKPIPALGILCQSGHLGCRVTNQDKQDHGRCYL